MIIFPDIKDPIEPMFEKVKYRDGGRIERGIYFIKSTFVVKWYPSITASMKRTYGAFETLQEARRARDAEVNRLRHAKELAALEE